MRISTALRAIAERVHLGRSRVPLSQPKQSCGSEIAETTPRPVGRLQGSRHDDERTDARSASMHAARQIILAPLVVCAAWTMFILVAAPG